MDTNAVISPLILIIIPLLGLTLGAIFPPFQYAKRPGLAGSCNVLGFILYIFPFMMAAGARSFFGNNDDFDFAAIVLFGTATFFFCIEALVFFLLWLKKRLRATLP